jgi:hypothetical protein
MSDDDEQQALDFPLESWVFDWDGALFLSSLRESLRKRTKF